MKSARGRGSGKKAKLTRAPRGGRGSRRWTCAPAAPGSRSRTGAARCPLPAPSRPSNLRESRPARRRAPLTRLAHRRRRCGRGRELQGGLGRLRRAAVLLGVDVLGFRLLAPRHGASMGAPGEPRRLAHSATNSWSWEIYPPSAGTRMSQ